MNDTRWWVLVSIAVVVKLMLSEVKSWTRAVTSAAAAFLTAVVFTDPLISLLGWSPDRYKIAVAVTLALFGENVVRRVMDITSSETFLKDIISIWRGK